MPPHRLLPRLWRQVPLPGISLNRHSRLRPPGVDHRHECLPRAEPRIEHRQRQPTAPNQINPPDQVNSTAREDKAPRPDSFTDRTVGSRRFLHARTLTSRTDNFRRSSSSRCIPTAPTSNFAIPSQQFLTAPTSNSPTAPTSNSPPRRPAVPAPAGHDFPIAPDSSSYPRRLITPHRAGQSPLPLQPAVPAYARTPVPAAENHQPNRRNTDCDIGQETPFAEYHFAPNSMIINTFHRLWWTNWDKPPAILVTTRERWSRGRWTWCGWGGWDEWYRVQVV
jgi:hypothetical protein